VWRLRSDAPLGKTTAYRCRTRKPMAGGTLERDLKEPLKSSPRFALSISPGTALETAALLQSAVAVPSLIGFLVIAILFITI